MNSTTPTRLLTTWLEAIEIALSRGETSAALELFGEDCFWRDLVTFTWNIKTMEGPAEIDAMLQSVLARVQPRNWQLDGDASVAEDGSLEGWITFETEIARGRGHVRLVDGRCWTLLTTMVELKGFEEKKGPRRERGTVHGAIKGRKSWLELKTEREARLGYEDQPYCLIVGGGQGGIALGSRLRRLGVPTIILESNPRAGDSWRKRYKSLCLHDPVWYDHLPYLPFPDDWPVYTPKDKLGDWLEAYVKIMELNYWTSSVCRSASYDAIAGEWTVVVQRGDETVTLKPKQLILATGMAGVPNMPALPGRQDFKGELQHSSQHPGGEAYAGKRCVIVGSNNSAHDICANLWEHGAEVTMIQRSSTLVARAETLMDLGSSKLYSEAALARGITTDIADMTNASVPYRVMSERMKPMYVEMRKRDAAFYRKLEKAGFRLDFGEDESGLFMKYLRRGSGYYIDVGASELIANGAIKLVQGQIAGLTEDGAVMEDGTELPADLIVCATGYGSMNGWAAELISQEVADKVGKVWGLGSNTINDPGPWEGELRNMWKPTQQDSLWFHGGNLFQSRLYSHFLALQLKARMEGLETPVYGLQKSYHKS